MSVEQKIQLSELQHQFKIKNAKLNYLNVQEEMITAQRKVIALELNEIQAELILMEQTKNNVQERQSKADVLAVVEPSSYVDVGLNLFDDKDTNEFTLDLTQPTEIMQPTKQQPIYSAMNNIENYLANN